jgi:hypothetical protein
MSAINPTAEQPEEPSRMTPNPSSPSHLQPSDAIRRPGASLPWGAWWCGQVVLGMLCATVGAGCGQSSDQGPPGADAGVTTPGTGGAPSGTGGSSVGSGGSPAPGSGSGGVAVAGTGGMPAGTGGAATSASGGVTASATGGVSAAPGRCGWWWRPRRRREQRGRGWGRSSGCRWPRLRHGQDLRRLRELHDANQPCSLDHHGSGRLGDGRRHPCLQWASSRS